ncbi:MAG: hypothetical protein ABIB72_03640 [Candidatus Falkowbacteria bacterium]
MVKAWFCFFCFILFFCSQQLWSGSNEKLIVKGYQDVFRQSYQINMGLRTKLEEVLDLVGDIVSYREAQEFKNDFCANLEKAMGHISKGKELTRNFSSKQTEIEKDKLFSEMENNSIQVEEIHEKLFAVLEEIIRIITEAGEAGAEDTKL